MQATTTVRGYRGACLRGSRSMISAPALRWSHRSCVCVPAQAPNGLDLDPNNSSILLLADSVRVIKSSYALQVTV